MTSIELNEESKVELGSLVSQVRSTAMPNELPISTHFIGLEDVIPHEGRIRNSSYTSEVKSRVFLFSSGDVLYGRLRPYLSKVALVDFDGAASAEFIVLRCSEKILPRYLLMILLSEDFTGFISARVKGDRPRTSFATVSSYKVELPSIEVQADICARDIVLAGAMEKLNEAIESNKNASEQLIDAMRTKLIWSSLSPESRVKFSDLVQSIEYGTAQKSSYENNGTPTLRIPNISSSGEINTTDLKYTNLNKNDLEKYSLKINDLLLIRSNGSLSLVGRTAKVGCKEEGYAFAGYLLRMRPKEGILSDFMLELIKSRPFRKLIEAAARSSTGINNLSATRLASFSVPLLGVKGQERAVKVLSDMHEKIRVSTDRLSNLWSNSLLFREVARATWLGHSIIEISDQNTNAKDQEAALPFVKMIEMDVDDDIEKLILKRIDTITNSPTHFALIFEGVKADYDVRRDAVFKMLSATPPRLIQVYDEESRSIVLRRPK